MPTPSTPGPSSTSPADRWWSAAHGDHELCIRQRIARRLDDHADRPFRTTRARRGRHGWDEPAGGRAVLVAHGAARAGRPGPRGGRRGSGPRQRPPGDLLALFWLTGGRFTLRFLP